MFRLHRRWGGALLVLALPVLAAAQTLPVRPRITDRLDETRLAVLQGNTYPLARPQYDQGVAPPNLAMDRMLLMLRRSPEQEAALQDMLGQQQDKSSPNYHKWLTPDLFGQQFGPADQDIQVITAWLTSQGFQSIQVSKGRTVIEFSGTAAQVQSALHTAIHKYAVNGEEHWANANDPQIPAALAPVIAGVVSLHNFPKKPMIVRSGHIATVTTRSDAQPEVTFTDRSHGLAPADFNLIYNVAPIMTGSGATIGVIARSNINVQDVRDFRSLSGLPPNDPQVIVNGPNPGNLLGSEEAEAVLDATWSGAVAPSATVKLVVSEDTNAAAGVDLSEFYIIDNNLADVMTESFSTCEANFAGSPSVATYYATLAEQAAAQGITFLVASGDAGPDGCDVPSALPTTLSPASANLLAATPFNVAVGGTQFFNDPAGPSTYWNASNGANLGSANTYIPEKVWNESCTVAQCGSSLSGLWSSGGGQSIFTLKPSWQSGVAGIPTTTFRVLPDVSLAAADHDGYVLCVDASCNGSSKSFEIASGTSVSVQAFGGVMALVVQKNGRQGQANNVLYKLAGSQTAACDGSNTATPPDSTCIFNDVTSGNTNLTVGSGETGFAATPGYDEATGLGSVNVSNLVNQWNTAAGNATTTTLKLNGGAAVNVAHGSAVPVLITVAPVSGTGTPTGDVSLVANSSTDKGIDGFTLTAGSANSSTTLLPGGTYQVTAHYSGDKTFTGSNSIPPISVTVNPEASKTGVAIVTAFAQCTTSNSIVYGSPYILSAAVIDNNGSGPVCAPAPSGSVPTGTVALTDDGNPLDGGSFSLNSFGYFEDQTIQLPVGTHTIKASYGGDNSFSSSSSTDVVTVTQCNTITTTTTPATKVSAGQQVTITVLVDSNSPANPSGGSNGANIGGTVSFTTPSHGGMPPAMRPNHPNWLTVSLCAILGILSLLLARFPVRQRWGVAMTMLLLAAVVGATTSCGSSPGATAPSVTTLGTQSLTATKDSQGFVAGQASITISPTVTESITAIYTGDPSYKSSSSTSVTITVQ